MRARVSYKSKSGYGPLVAVMALITLFFTIIAAWFTHVIVCIKAAAWILLVIGIIMPPIGLVHGIAVWFGIL